MLSKESHTLVTDVRLKAAFMKVSKDPERRPQMQPDYFSLVTEYMQHQSVAVRMDTLG
jgi:hypothetical protein